MKWLIDNWSFLVVVACIFGIGVVYVHKFVNLPSNSQLEKIKQWLLFAVIEAEKKYQGGTGELKLRAVYNEFCKVFPSLVPIVSFKLFSILVDEALVQMRYLLESNYDIHYYVEGKNE